MLRLEGVTAGYGPVQVLHDLSFSAAAGEVTCIMGRNGAGKSTLMKAIMGLVRGTGRITLDGVETQDLPPHRVPRLGIGYVPQGRRLFGPLTVAENLAIGLMTRGQRAERLAAVLALFPRLAERMDQVSSTLSGGEQQMLAIARALCVDPSVLLLDEPGEGLQPSMTSLIGDVINRLRDQGVAIVLVEQRVDTVLHLANRVAFMDRGRVAATLAAAALRSDAPEFRQFVGV